MKGLGRKISVDPRDRSYLMAARVELDVPLPVSKVWAVPKPALDQRRTSTCVGHAWKHFLMSEPLLTLTGPDALTIYDECTRVDEWADNDSDTRRAFGTSVRAGAKVLQARGHLSEYLWAFDEETLRRFVMLRGPAVIGVNWRAGFNKTDGRGFVRFSGAIEGGHAVLVNGFSGPRNAYRCLNSWGRWGENLTGKFWLRRTDMARLLGEGGEACSALEVALV